MEQKCGKIPKTWGSKPFLFSQPLSPPTLALVWIKLNEAWKSLCCERCTVNMKRWCPSSLDVNCKFQYHSNPSSVLEQMGKPHMTAHQRYWEQVLLEAHLQEMNSELRLFTGSIQRLLKNCSPENKYRGIKFETEIRIGNKRCICSILFLLKQIPI